MHISNKKGRYRIDKYVVASFANIFVRDAFMDVDCSVKSVMNENGFTKRIKERI